MIPEMYEILDFNGYYITKDGRVFSSKKYNELKEMVTKEDKDGYLEVGLYKGGKRYFRRVHRIVANQFVENPLNLPQVNHKDGNVKNNSVNNLEWVTSAENIYHSYHVLNRVQLPTTGTPVKLVSACGDTIEFASVADLARHVDMSSEHIYRIIKGVYDISKSKKLKNFKIELI